MDNFIGLSHRPKSVQMTNFTQAERAVWLIVKMRGQINNGSFADVFNQSLTLEEIKEAIQHLNHLKFDKIANIVSQALALVQAEDFYGANGRPIKALPFTLIERLSYVGDQIEDKLWEIDDALYAMLQAEQSS